MFKVIASRGAGKTTSLMYYANDLAHKYPDKNGTLCYSTSSTDG